MVDSLQWLLPSCDWSNLKFALPCLEVATAPHCIKETIVSSNDPKPDLIYASLQLAFHPICALSARKCIAQYRLKFQIIHCHFFFWIRPCLYDLLWPDCVSGRSLTRFCHSGHFGVVYSDFRSYTRIVPQLVKSGIFANNLKVSQIEIWLDFVSYQWISGPLWTRHPTS